MYKYTFKDGHTTTSKLDTKELLLRMRRLDVLRVMTEGYEEDEGYNICKKAIAAYDKAENFTGIIRLTFLEKDFLGYILDESGYLNEEEIKVLKFYIR